MIVYTNDLVDKSNNAIIYGKLYAWKDYADNFFVTVSLNATGFGNNVWPKTSLGDEGQYLMAEPSLYNPGTASGQISVWGSFLPGTPSSYANYDTTNMLSSNR